MHPPLALVVWLALAPAALAAPAPQADWRREAAVDERVKTGLSASGWRFEEDGRALDPKTKAPADKSALDKAVRDLLQGARRAALEKANLLLSKPRKDWEPADFAAANTLASELPPGLAKGLLDPKSDPAKLKAMADAELSSVAAYFDGSKTLADRQAAASPVTAAPSGPRVDLPYFTSAEKIAGDKLRAAAAAEIGRDPYGKTVLARLNGPDGKPDLPPILIEDQGGSVVAHYDMRRQAVILDRELTVASIVGSVPPRHRIALRESLATRAALLSYLSAHPEALSAVIKENDVVLVHELTHAWQDRRDPVMRETVRGNIPEMQILEYEHEAYLTKNLYIHSKLKNDPASVRIDDEFADYTVMMHGQKNWRDDLFKRLGGQSPSRALTTEDAEAIMAARIDATKKRATPTTEEQQAKALDLAGMTRGAKQLAALRAAYTARIAPLQNDISRYLAPERARLLVTFYLGKAEHAESDADRIALLDKAGWAANSTQDPVLIEAVRKAKEKKP